MLLADFLDGVIKLLNAGFHLVEQSHQGTYSDNMEFQGRNIANGRNRRAHLFGPGRCFGGAAPMTAKECFQGLVLVQIRKKWRSVRVCLLD
jgi:hypothetical protein